jgi:hypothetical protein
MWRREDTTNFKPSAFNVYISSAYFLVEHGGCYQALEAGTYEASFHIRMYSENEKKSWILSTKSAWFTLYPSAVEMCLRLSQSATNVFTYNHNAARRCLRWLWHHFDLLNRWCVGKVEIVQWPHHAFPCRYSRKGFTLDRIRRVTAVSEES